MKSSKALWDLLSLLGGELLSKVAGFIAFAYLARTLTAESYGIVELAFGLLVFFSSIVTFGYGPIGARGVATSPDGGVHLSSTIISSRVLLALLCLPLMIATAWFLDVGDTAWLLVLITSVALFSAPFDQRWLLQGLEKMTWVSLAQVIRMTVFLVCVLLLVTQGSSVVMVGVIEVVASFAVVGYFLISQHRLGIPLQFNFNWSDIRDITTKASSIGIGQIVWTFNQNLPTLLIMWFVGAVELAWYGAALRIVNALASFSMLYHFNIYPTVVRRLNSSQEDYRQLSVPSVRICAWGGVFVAFVGVLIAKPLCMFAFGEQYSQSGSAMAVLIWTIPLALISGHARWALIASARQKYVMIAQVSGCLSCLVFGVLLIPRYHALGGSIAMVLSAFTVLCVAHFFACRLVTNITLVPVIKPLVLAVVLLAISMQVGFTGLAVAAPIIAFTLIAPLFDTRLIRDIPALMRIKSEAV